jgi:hypothetical protein
MPAVLSLKCLYFEKRFCPEFRRRYPCPKFDGKTLFRNPAKKLGHSQLWELTALLKL